MEVLTGKLKSSKDRLRKDHSDWLERKIKKLTKKIKLKLNKKIN